MKPHKLAFLFPEIDPKHYQELKDDIQAHGLIDQITTYDQQILDGRHRYQICHELKIELTPENFVEFVPSEKLSAVDFVVSKNQMRRHLNTAQKTAAGVKIAKAYAEEAKLRSASNLQKGASPIAPIGAIGTEKTKSSERAALAVGVSPRSVERGIHISDNFPALFGKIETGEMTVGAAEKIAKAEEKKYTPADEEPEPAAGDPFVDEWKAKHKQMRDLREELKMIVVRMKAIDAPIRAHMSIDSFEAHLKMAMQEIHLSVPDKKCPYCRGKGCNYCHDAGWITAHMYDRLPKEMKTK